MGVSLNPDEASAGLPVDITATVTKSRYVLRDGVNSEGEEFSNIVLQWDMEDEHGAPFVQWYSVGSPERFQVTKEGREIEPIDGDWKISKRSRVYALMEATVKAGFPANRVEGDASVFDGMVCEMIGLDWKNQNGTVTLPVPGRVIKLPGESGGSSTKGSTNGTVDTDAILELLAEAVAEDGKTTRTKMANLAVARKLGAAAPKYIYGAEFQAAAEEAGYRFKGATISIE